MADTSRNVNRVKDLPKDQVYEGVQNPYVLVINNVNFKEDPVPRNGAEHDLKNVETFLREAGFESVEKRYDLEKKEMMAAFDETRKSIESGKHDGLICIIMSHGDDRGIKCKNGETIPVDEITSKFRGSDESCPQLAGKPKLFFLQACRGIVDDRGYRHAASSQDDDVVADSFSSERTSLTLPSDADFLISYSTTTGYKSYRRFTMPTASAPPSETLGSWFIFTLMRVLRENSHKDDLMTMLTKVNQEMIKYATGKGCKQIPSHVSMLTRKVFFTNFFNKTF
ncbi:caspase-3 isoform X2 [Pocillopora verrucosa]